MAIADVLNGGQNEQQCEGLCQMKEQPQEDENDILQISDLHEDIGTEQATDMDDVLKYVFKSMCSLYDITFS